MKSLGKRFLAALFIWPILSFAEAVIDAPLVGGIGYECYEKLENETERPVSSHRGEVDAVTACQTEKLKSPGVYHTRPTGGERHIVISGDAQAQLNYPVQVDTTNPSPEDPGPPSPWQELVVCTTPETDCVSSTRPLTNNSFDYDSGSGAFQLTAQGGATVGTDDSFVAYQYTTDTTSDQTFIARVTAATQLSASPNKALTGIMVREDTAVGSVYHSIVISGLNGIQSLHRTTTDAGNDPLTIITGTAATLPYCFKAEIDVSEDSLKLFDSANCSDYTERIHVVSSEWGSGVAKELLLFVTPSDIQSSGFQSNGTFDSVSVATDAVDHSGAESSQISIADPAPISEESTPLTFVVTRSGSGSGACDIDVDTADGSGISTIDYAPTNCNLTWSDAETGAKNCAVTIIDRDGENQGTKQFTAGITVNDCTDTVTDDTATGTIQDADVLAGNWVTMTPAYDSIVPAVDCDGCNWDSVRSGADFEVVYITNLNTSGQGSLNACTQGGNDSLFRFCVPNLSGKIFYTSGSQTTVTRDRLVVMMHVAPSPGLYVQGSTMVTRGQFQFWMHYGCFGVSGPQANAKCINLNDTPGSLNNIVLLNPGCVFGYDGCIDLYDNASNTSIIGAIMSYPIGLSGGGTQGRFSSLWGCNGGCSANNMLIRGVMAHANGRNPKINGMVNGNMANNVIFNPQNVAVNAGFGGGGGISANLEYNLLVRGAATSAGMPMLTIESTVSSGSEFFLHGNCVDQDFSYSDASQLNLVSNGGGATVIATGDTDDRVATVPANYVPTPMTCGDAGELAMAQLDCRDAGPRPLDRHPHFQTVCDQIINALNQTTPIGSQISSPSQHPNGGYPTIPVNTCNPEVENSCGAGMPALPIGGDLDDMFDYAAASHCARVATGGTGCPL